MSDFGELPEEHELPSSWHKARRGYLVDELHEVNESNGAKESHGRRAKSHKTWRPDRRRVWAGVAAAAVVAIGAVSIAGPFDATAGRDRPSRSVALDGSRLILANSEKAVVENRDAIVHTFLTYGESGSAGVGTRAGEQWFDRGNPNNSRTLSFDVDGSKAWDAGELTTDGITQRRRVDFSSRTVTESNGADTPTASKFEWNPTSDAALVGEEMIGSIKTSHFRYTDGDMTSDIWVDAVTLLPVRFEGRKGAQSSRIDYEWLPRNESTLQALLPEIPAGFSVAQESFAPTVTSLPLVP